MRFGWSRLAYLLITLTILAALVKLSALPTGANPGETVSGPLQTLRDASPFGNGSLEDVSPEALEAHAETEHETSPETLPETPNGTTAPRDDHEEDHAAEAVRDHEHDHSDGGHAGEATVSLYRDVDFRSEAPVFYRPTVEGRVGSRTSESGRNRGGRSGGKSCENVNAAPRGAKIVFPMTREFFDAYEDTWGAARPQGGHEGTDIMAPDGAPEFAMTDGTVVPVSGANANGWNTLGGYTVMVRADYSIGPVREGDLFYYAHLNQPTRLKPGDTVKAGDVVGYSGDTGEGPEGTRGGFPPHLHLGWYDISGGRSQVASGAMNPYPLLEWIKANGGSIKGGENVPYCVAEQPATPTPAAGGSWTYPANPGVRPDMDTGSSSPAPSPWFRPRPPAESAPNSPQTGESDPQNGEADGAGSVPDDPNAATAEGEPVAGPPSGPPSGATVGAGAAIEPGSPEPPTGGQAGTAPGGAPGTEATGALPRGFWNLGRAERVRLLLRLERLGLDLPPRLERWLERVLDADYPAQTAPETDAPAAPNKGAGSADNKGSDAEGAGSGPENEPVCDAESTEPREAGGGDDCEPAGAPEDGEADGDAPQDESGGDSGAEDQYLDPEDGAPAAGRDEDGSVGDETVGDETGAED